MHEAHLLSGHMGREVVMSRLRMKYFIYGITGVVKRVLRKCIICKRVQGKCIEQFISDLPSERLEECAPPFSNVGIDIFGNFYVTRGRGKSVEKRYGVIFSCLVTRAVHIEICYDLSMNGFMNAFRRFTCRRGSVKVIHSDNGTNLRASRNELGACLDEWNQSLTHDRFAQIGVQWIFHPPGGSHFGGVYEREIRCIRNILNSVFLEFSNQIKMTDELLITLFCEVEEIMNNRPLTAITADLNDLEALKPNHLIRLNAGENFSPCFFEENEFYLRKRWRKVQLIADAFWKRWRNEYVPLLLARQKWCKKRRSCKVGDLVLVVDQLLPRNLWCIGRIIKVFPGSDGCVRKVDVRVSRSKQRGALELGTKVLSRPIKNWFC